MPPILWSASLSLIVTYGINVQNVFHRILWPLCYCMGCMWRCNIITMTTFAARLFSFVLMASLQAFIVRSTIKIMAESKRFLLSLTRNEQIENRLLTISTMNRFNVKLSIILALPLTCNILHHLSDSLVPFFSTTYLNLFETYYLIFDTIDALVPPTCSILFVMLHLNRFRQFCS